MTALTAPPAVTPEPTVTAPLTVPAAAVRSFATRVLVAAGAAPDAAELCAEVLVDADLSGTDSHGVARLPQYAAVLASGRVRGDARPRVVGGGGAVLTVDGDNCLGPLALGFATDLAVRTARRHGLAAVAVRGSNHAGGMGWYTERAVRAGMFAMILTGSTKAMVAPTNGAAPYLGTNAVAYGAPANGETLLFDAATSVVSRSRLEAYQRAGWELPAGWAVDPDGRPAHDPSEVIDGIDALTGHSLLPFGGADGEHKGFGISLLVELLCGPLAGACWGPRLPEDGPVGVGHFVLCLDLAALGGSAEQTERRVAALCAGLRAVPGTADGRSVRLPGERRSETAVRRTREGIPLPATVLAELDRVAAVYDLAPLDRSSRPTGDSHA